MSRLFADYHTHPQGHRLRPYSPELLQPWIDSARVRGVTDLAFTDHDRYHAGINFDQLDRIRERNPDLRIRAGIELDNDPQTGALGREWVERNWDQLDLVLGSIHYLNRPDQMFDTVPAGAEQFRSGDEDEIYADYFRRVEDLAETGLVDCLAHFDLVKIHGHRPSVPVSSLVGEALDVICSRGLVLELSTAGWRKPINELYPSDEIIKLAQERGIPFTVASDAHSPVQVGDNYSTLAEKMRLLGIKEICIFNRHRRHFAPIPENQPDTETPGMV